MSGFFRFLAFLLGVGLLVAVGVGIYNAGVSAGLGTDAGLPPYVGQPWDMGWVGGIFGFIFGLFFLFLFFGLIFGLFRAAFGWGHGGRHHGWRDYRGYRYGGRDHHGRKRDYFEEWHRELHGQASDAPDAPPVEAPGKPTSDQA
ncbi:MAG TPA: hypothetical protein VJ839_06110 [Candidatus Limnocylindria bacterium]|nr:hypothetical protein [Candidatus Limnocylindria bacterium]